MEHPSKLEENLDALLAKLSHLRYLRDNSKIREDHQINRWLNNLEDCDREVNEIQKRLHELKSGFHPNKFNVRRDLNKKVIKTLNELELLEQEGGEESKSIQMFIIEQKKGTPQQFSHEQLIGFTSNERIGYGGFADVYKGEINGVLVAIKVLKDSVGHVMKKQFMAEVSTMFMTSHRNLVKLHGYCYHPKFIALVCEYMENGSLDKILYSKQPSIQWEELYDIAIQIAKGLCYLHDGCNVRIIHHDVKAANVLLDSNFSPKVTDFGLAKIYKSDKNHASQSQIGGTRIYAAPEVLLGSRVVTFYCDVFSFGMMLFEILLRKKMKIGEAEERFPRKVWETFEKGQLEKIILECGIEKKNKEKAYTLSIAALWCIQYNPFDRPSMSTVINVLEGILQFPPPPNPFPYSVSSIRSNTSSVSTRTGGPPHSLEFSGVSPPSYEWLGEKLPNLESENQVLRHNVLAVSRTAKALSTQPKATIVQRTPENGHTQSGETSVPLDMTPAISSFREPEIEGRPQKSLDEEQQENHDLLIKCISQDLGFSGGRPVAACLVYKCLLHWRSFQVERTSVFDLIIQTIGSSIEVQDNNDTLSYWLSNSSTLLLLLQQELEHHQQRRTLLASLFGWMSQVFRGLQVEAKSPTLLFKMQLIAFLERICRRIRVNLEEEIRPILFSCIFTPRTARGVVAQQAIIGHMQRIVEILNKYLRILTGNYVPPFLVHKVFTETFSFINVILFNSILLHRECCSFSNGESVKYGLTELEKWCSSATEEVRDSAWDELRHIRQAVGFLATDQKKNMTLNQIKELCPVLRIPQLYKMSIMYLDEENERYGCKSISSDVISSMNSQMFKEYNDDVSSSSLINVGPRILFSVDDLLNSMQQIDIADIDPPPLIRKV